MYPGPASLLGEPAHGVGGLSASGTPSPPPSPGPYGPCRALAATGGSWRTTTVAGSVALKAGVQALRVSIAGAANALDLDSIVVSGG